MLFVSLEVVVEAFDGTACNLHNGLLGAPPPLEDSESREDELGWRLEGLRVNPSFWPTFFQPLL